MKTGIITFLLLVIPVCFIKSDAFGQTDSLKFFEKAGEYKPARGLLIGTSLGTSYAVSMTGLYSLWYKDYAMGNFHFFDDNAEWLQVDKVGHFASAYYLGKWGMDLFIWTGMERKKAIMIGGTTGWLFLTTIEIFDGFSNEWGFSAGDMIANTAGSAMAISQQLIWNEQRIKFKFSFHQSDYSKYRPDQLGSTYSENIFKDYNGQTYWLSGNIHSFLNKDSSFPKWLNLAIGYGAEGMTGARSNVISESAGNTTGIKRYRQFYLAPDIDLTKIPTKRKGLKALFGFIGFIKIPAPAIEINGKSDIKLHWLYF